jgi:hypothetical protein
MKRIILFLSPAGLLCAVPLKSNLMAVAVLFLALAAANWMALWLDVLKEMQGVGTSDPAGDDAVDSVKHAAVPVAEKPPKSAAPRAEPATPKTVDGSAELLKELETARAELAANSAELTRLQEHCARLDASQQTVEQDALDAKAQLSKLEKERAAMNARIVATADELSAQIMVSLSETEQAISAAITAFTCIADEAQEATGIVQQAMGRDAETSIVQIAKQTNEILNTFVNGIVHTSSEIMELSRNLQLFRQTANRLLVPLNTIESVTAQTNMIAVSTAKAAAKDKESNPTLKAIVDRVGELGDTSHKASEQLRELMTGVTETIDKIADTISEMGQNSLRAGVKAQQDMHHLLPLMQAAAQVSENALANLSAKSANIGTHYKDIVMAFQFHDMLRQRLEHVAQPLSILRDTLNFADGASPDEVNARLLSAIESTQAAIPAAGKAPGLGTVEYAPGDDGGDVTLF